MSQTRFGSWVESWTNIVVGFAMNYVLNLTVLPLLGLPVSHGQALSMGVIFTGFSLVRSYLLRRLFNQIRFGNVRIAR